MSNCHDLHLLGNLRRVLQRHDVGCLLGATAFLPPIKRLGLRRLHPVCCRYVLSQITPVALGNISWRYYAVFIATNMTAAVVYL